MQPEAGLKVPLSLPVIFEEASHACVGHFPLLDTVFPDLLNGWFSHCWAGTYADASTAAPIIRTLRRQPSWVWLAA